MRECPGAGSVAGCHSRRFLSGNGQDVQREPALTRCWRAPARIEGRTRTRSLCARDRLEYVKTHGRGLTAVRDLSWTRSAGQLDGAFTRVVQMAEISQLGRIRSLARAVAIDVGVGPRAVGRIRRLFGSLNIWFWAIVGLPTLVAGVYFFAVASDLYLSEAKFVVRSPKQVQTSTIGALLQSTGISHAVDDSAAVQDFIMSRDAVRKLEQRNDLRAVFGRPEGDLVTRFPGILRRSDFEALFRRYDLFVAIETDNSTGVTTLRVKAYRPEDARMVASALLSYAEQLINELNDRARGDALDIARREVRLAEERISHIQSELTAYRVQQKMIDPKSASAGVLELIGQMNGALATARTQLGEVLKNSPNSPQIPLIRTRIASLEKLLAEERTKLSGDTDSVVASLTEYERLVLDRELAEKALASAFTSLEAARLEAQRQQLYLETIAQPNLADYPLYPKRAISFGMVLASCLLAYLIAWLLVISAREHAAA
jgi:capsular polysaccharide transport system permease protein